MFNSIKGLMTSDFNVKPYISTGGTGADSFDEVLTIKGYLVRKSEIVFDLKGREVVSKFQLFTFDNISELDEVVIESSEYNIKKLDEFSYKDSVLKVVYL